MLPPARTFEPLAMYPLTIGLMLVAEFDEPTLTPPALVP